MEENPVITAHAAKTNKKTDESWGGFTWFLVKLVLVVLAFRAFVFSPFTIPSESMLPRLMNGDYLIAAKWPYGYSKLSLPYEVPLIPGRVFASLPERGDVAIFKHPVDGIDYIKRVIALPGDTVELREGRVILNGEVLKYQMLDDAMVPLSANTTCHPFAQLTEDDDATTCVYPQLQEVLPSQRSYPVIDLGPAYQDNFGPVTVPDGKLFVLGDNRDNSQDSRFDAEAQAGVGLVPAELLVGRATMILWSTDGSAQWSKPWTWFTSVRWNRIGNTL
ncbi:signal peptidase I [Erythrobacter sp. W53]|uniref:signal peptidase I n=1 Tax=Erythrobacter sp. W53 TaxID=3425947 RepID=UPI003D769F8D